MGRRAWQATVHRVVKSRTQLKQLCTHLHVRTTHTFIPRRSTRLDQIQSALHNLACNHAEQQGPCREGNTLCSKCG